MHYENIRSAFIELIPDIQREVLLLSNGNCGACYTLSEMSRRILQSFGVTCGVVFVSGVIENEIAKKLHATISPEHPAFKQALIETGGYTMGVGIGNDDNGHPNFHAVLFIRGTEEILDMTFMQFNRPKYDIHMPDYFYDKAESYMAMYSDNFPKGLYKFSDFKKIFTPMIDTEPKCKDIIRRYKKLLSEKLTKVALPQPIEICPKCHHDSMNEMGDNLSYCEHCGEHTDTIQKERE